MEVSPPEGPRRIGPKSQLSLSPALMKAIGVARGDDVWVGVNPDRPGTLVVIPRELAMKIFEKGWTALS